LCTDINKDVAGLASARHMHIYAGCPALQAPAGFALPSERVVAAMVTW